MILPEDRIDLAPDVDLVGRSLVDRVQRASYPLNETGVFVLGERHRPLADVAAALSRAYRIPGAQATEDVLAFAATANTALLVSVRPGGARAGRLVRWVGRAARLAPFGTIPTQAAQRHRLDTRNPARVVAGVARATASRAALFGVLAAALVTETGFLLSEPSPAPVIGAGLGVGLGLVVHEWSHTFTLGGRPAAIAITSSRVVVLHGPLSAPRTALTAAAGPGLTALIGSLLVEGARLTLADAHLPLGGALAAHAVGLTALSSDGRAACDC